MSICINSYILVILFTVVCICCSAIANDNIQTTINPMLLLMGSVQTVQLLLIHSARPEVTPITSGQSFYLVVKEGQ